VWQGLARQRARRRGLLTKLHADVMKALAAPDLRQRFVEQGVDSAPSSTEAFSAFIRAGNGALGQDGPRVRASSLNKAGRGMNCQSTLLALTQRLLFAIR
jgi:hypothetical protein